MELSITSVWNYIKNLKYKQQIVVTQGHVQQRIILIVEKKVCILYSVIQTNYFKAVDFPCISINEQFILKVLNTAYRSRYLIP